MSQIPITLTVRISLDGKANVAYESNAATQEQLQQLLEVNVFNSMQQMGIGTGAFTDSSGEKAIFDRLKNSIQKNQPLCIFDVGANKGQFITLVKNCLNDIPYRIHAFEPGLSTWKILSGNSGNSPNIILNNIGLGEKSEHCKLYYDEPGSGLASLTKRKLDHYGIDFKHSETVEIDTLDNYCKNNSIEHIDLLKIDVEGHELDVLQGGMNMFNNKTISMVSFEFGGCNIDSRTFFRDFFFFFMENGFKRLFRILPSGLMAPVSHYNERLEQFTTTNFLAIHDTA